MANPAKTLPVDFFVLKSEQVSRPRLAVSGSPTI